MNLTAFSIMATTTATNAPLTTTTANAPNNPTAATPPLSPRIRVARLILIYHFTLIAASSVYYILRGFDFEEFTSLIGILGPVTALYGGAVFRYIGRSITEPNLNGHGGAPISSLVKWLVNGHFAIVFGLITLKAFAPNILNFQDMTMFLTFVESAIGIYMGNIILALFEDKPGSEAKAK
jgi:hypothetical protein